MNDNNLKFCVWCGEFTVHSSENHTYLEEYIVCTHFREKQEFEKNIYDFTILNEISSN